MPMRFCRIGFFKVPRADAAQMQKWPVRMNWPFLCGYVDETGEARSAGDENRMGQASALYRSWRPYCLMKRSLVQSPCVSPLPAFTNSRSCPTTRTTRKSAFSGVERH